MTPEIGRMFGQPQPIGAPEQHQKHPKQVGHFTLRDGHVPLLGQHDVNLGHGPVFPEPPVANLDNDLQRKTTATEPHPFRGL